MCVLCNPLGTFHFNFNLATTVTLLQKKIVVYNGRSSISSRSRLAQYVSAVIK